MALNGLGLTRLALGDRRGAAEAFRESLRLDPNQPDVTRTLGEIAAAGWKRDSAARCSRGALRSPCVRRLAPCNSGLRRAASRTRAEVRRTPPGRPAGAVAVHADERALLGKPRAPTAGEPAGSPADTSTMTRPRRRRDARGQQAAPRRARCAPRSGPTCRECSPGAAEAVARDASGFPYAPGGRLARGPAQHGGRGRRRTPRGRGARISSRSRGCGLARRAVRRRCLAAGAPMRRNVPASDEPELRVHGPAQRCRVEADHRHVRRTRSSTASISRVPMPLAARGRVHEHHADPGQLAVRSTRRPRCRRCGRRGSTAATKRPGFRERSSVQSSARWFQPDARLSAWPAGDVGRPSSRGIARRERYRGCRFRMRWAWRVSATACSNGRSHMLRPNITPVAPASM